MSGPLAGLPTITGTVSRRASSWDRTGGNRDCIAIPPGDSHELVRVDRPGVVRHLWMTAASDDPHHLRTSTLRTYWDGASTPCIETPLGDFFGLGHARTASFWSLPLQMGPQDGKGLNCWFPMPFDTARIEVANDGAVPLTLYFYIDYELTDAHGADAGRFHARWHRENPTDGIDRRGRTNDDYLFGGANLDGAGNYVILEAAGEGHYVGCHLDIVNRSGVGSDTFDWYGEGDDMIFVDGEAFPPSLHGTGTEDYFGTAWCPTEAYSAPYHGVILPGGPNWSGEISLYRYHVEDPVRFRRSIRVTIEHGHANRRSDDVSSTAYWYQHEPHGAQPAYLSLEARLPVSRTALVDTVAHHHPSPG
jgi:Protein of unknown function (DUF2961)